MAHTPVLLKEMLSQLSPQKDGVYVDATFGAGEYSKAILESADCYLYAIDRDEAVTKYFDDLKVKYPGRIMLCISKFSEIKSIMGSAEPFPVTSAKGQGQENASGKMSGVDGVVFDVGFSTMQLEDADRGFSFSRDGPLDMSMDGGSEKNASTFVNRLPENEMADYIHKYGEERFSRRIAEAIVEARKKGTIKTTFELADIVRSAMRGKQRNVKIDPVTKTFQAIRIWVNDELEELEKGVKDAAEVLNENGRLVVVTFHSLEDRIVKNIFRDLCKPEAGKTFSLLVKKVITATPEELRENPRARSAKLRAIQRLT